MSKKHIKFLVCFILTFFLLTVNNNCSSEKVTVTATGQYLISKNEKISDGEQFALKEALRSAVEKVAVRVTSYTKTINQVLEEDIVEIFASSVVKITDKQVRPVVQGENVVIEMTITAVVDTKDIDTWKPPVRQQRIQPVKKKQTSANDNLATIIINKVQPLIREQRYMAAHQILSDAIRSGIEHPELYYQRGLLCMFTRQFSAAAIDFEKAIRLNPLPKYQVARDEAFSATDR